MQGYYVAGMYVSGDHLCHANVDVAGFWRNLKSGGRVWVNSFQRNVKGLASNVGKGISKGYRIGSQGKALQFGPTPQRAKNDPAYNVGYKIGTAALRAGHAAGTATRAISTGARNVARTVRADAKNVGKMAGYVGQGVKKGFVAGYRGNEINIAPRKEGQNRVGYAIGAGSIRAGQAIGKAAKTVKEWGGKAIDKAKTFITNLFSKIGDGAKAIPGLVNKAVTTLKTEAPGALEKGKTFMTQVFEAVNTARKDFSTGYSSGKAGYDYRQMPPNGNKTSTASYVGNTIGRGARNISTTIDSFGEQARSRRKKKQKTATNTTNQSSNYGQQSKRMF